MVFLEGLGEQTGWGTATQVCCVPSSGVGRRVAGFNTSQRSTVMLDISKSIVLYRSHRAVER